MQLGRRVLQQPGAADEIILPAPGRQAAHESLEDVPLDHRLPKKRSVAEQLKHRAAVVFAVPLEHPPTLQRDKRIVDVVGAAE